MSTAKSPYLPFVMWFFPLLFFAYQFILRLWPGLMAQQIMSQFSIEATQFGILAAFFYYGYAALQIPVAIYLDRYGVRSVVSAFAVLCGVATILFTYSTHWYLGCLSRFLVGAGSAVGFLGVSKVISDWFPKKRYGRMIGFSFTVGLMGAIYGGKPVGLLIETYHWKNVELTLAIVSIIIGCSTFVVLGSCKNRTDNNIKAYSMNLSDFKGILSSPMVWVLAIANLLMVGSLEGFSDVWGVPYLMVAYSIGKSDAAELISFVFFGMLFGGPFLAWCSSKLGNYSVIAICGFGTTVAFAILLLSTSYHWWLLALLFFTVGVMCCYQVIVFSAGSTLVSEKYLGVTIAFLNCINMLGGSFFHTVIGRLMDVFWVGEMNADGFRQYGLSSYHWTLMLIPACAGIGALMVCCLGWYRHQRQLGIIL